ncbi:MAG: hypothetical protein OXE99_07975 [Cellvibrionales bacterium]|nr:hypothetical protein [Cellvibrionales bacterium]
MSKPIFPPSENLLIIDDAHYLLLDGNTFNAWLSQPSALLHSFEAELSLNAVDANTQILSIEENAPSQVILVIDGDRQSALASLSKSLQNFQWLFDQYASVELTLLWTDILSFDDALSRAGIDFLLKQHHINPHQALVAGGLPVAVDDETTAFTLRDKLAYFHPAMDLSSLVKEPDFSSSIHLNSQLFDKNQHFDFALIYQSEYQHWSSEALSQLVGNLSAIEALLDKPDNTLQERRLLSALELMYSDISRLYFLGAAPTEATELGLIEQLKSRLASFFIALDKQVQIDQQGVIAQSDFVYSNLYASIYATVSNNEKKASDESLAPQDEGGIKALFARWMRAGQQNFDSAGAWLKTIGRDALGRLGQELSNSMSLIQVFGFIQTKHYYELTGELTADEKLDLQLQMVQLAELSEMPITWTIDTIRYFTASTKMATVRFLSNVSDLISKAFFVFGAFFGIAVDAYSIYVSAKLLSSTNDKTMKGGIIFGLVMSVLGFVVSFITAAIIVGFVVASIVSSVTTAAVLTAGTIVSGIAAGISSAMAMIGPIGLAVAMVMMLVSGLYGAITTVKRYSDKINLSAKDKLHLGVRAFFMSIIPIKDNFAPPDIENEYQRTITMEQYAQIYLDFRESYFARLIESLAYGSDKLYRVAFTIDSIELEVASTYTRGLENGYETYKPKEGVQRDTVVNFDSFNWDNLVKNANQKNVKDFQPDFPIGKMADSLDGNKGLYALKFEGWRGLTRAPTGATVHSDPKDDPYRYLGNNSTYPTLLGDFDGDGQSDIVRFMDRGLYVNTNTAGFFNNWEHLYQGFSTYRGGYTNQNEHPRLVGDFNGDGYDDIIGFQNEHVEVLINRRLVSAPLDSVNKHLGFGGFSLLKFPDPDKDSLNQSQSEPEKISQSLFTKATGFHSLTNEPRLIGDFNCDRKDDIVGSANDRLLLALSTSELNNFTPTFSLVDQERFERFKSKDWSSANLLTGDFNGDGCADLLGLSPSGFIMTTGTRAGQKPIKGEHNSKEYSESFSDSYLKIVADITNDNKDDVLLIREDGSFSTFISQGDGTFNYLPSKEDWFKYPKKNISLGAEDKDWLYFNINSKSSHFVGRDHDNAIYVHHSNSEIVRYVLGPDVINGEDGILAIELGDGNDEAIGMQNRSNHFYIGEGLKEFKGGSKDDKFILNTIKVPDTPSQLHGGTELQTTAFRQPPLYEPINNLSVYDKDLNQHDYFIGNVPFFNPQDVQSGKIKGLEINLDETSGYVKLRDDTKEIARLRHIEHATGHGYLGDHIIGSDRFNVLDGVGALDAENSDILEGNGGNDLLILNTFTKAYGGPGDDRYMMKKLDNTSISHIKDTEGDNSIILSSDFDQVIGLTTLEESASDLALHIDNGNDTRTYLILEGILDNESSIAQLNFTTRDGFSFVFDGSKGISKNFHYNITLSYDASRDITYASDLASSKGEIHVIQDLYYKKLQVVEMASDGTTVERVVRDVKIPAYATLQARSSDYHDEIHGTLSNDVFTAGKGNDYLVGRNGEDYYVVTADEKPELAGVTRINNFDPSGGSKYAKDVLRINLHHRDIQLVKSDDDLVIRDNSNNDMKVKDVIIERFFVSERYRHLFLNDIDDIHYEVLINEENKPYLGPGVIKGTDRNDDRPDDDGYVKKLVGTATTRTTILGLNGDDMLQARAASEDSNDTSIFDPANKGDILLGGDGSDVLVDSIGMDILKGENGNDLIVSTLGNDVIEPGLGVDHVLFLPGSRGLKTYLVPADTEGSLEQQRSKKIMVPYDIDDAIYQRVGDDLQIILSKDYAAFSSTDLDEVTFKQALDNALVIHVKDFYKSMYFRRFRLVTYDTNDLAKMPTIDRNVPGALNTVKQQDGNDLLESYREKSQLNQSGSVSIENRFDKQHAKTAQVDVTEPSLIDTAKHLDRDYALLIQAASRLRQPEAMQPLWAGIHDAQSATVFLTHSPSS